MRFTVRDDAHWNPGAKMGFRSHFVLAKLGFDMRDDYETLLNEPLPEEITRLVQALEAQRSKLSVSR